LGLLIGFIDWVYLLGYCIEMAYRKTVRKNGGKKKAGRASRKGGLKKSMRATRKGGLKKGGLSRRVKRGGKYGVRESLFSTLEQHGSRRINFLSVN
jgi:hypothetical protein